jgi:hypothetical protein
LWLCITTPGYAASPSACAIDVIQGTFGVIQGTFGVIQGTFGVIQGTFGVIQSMHWPSHLPSTNPICSFFNGI